MKKIAILASGGNAPAMNNAIITLVKQAMVRKMQPFVVYDGFQGLIEDKIEPANIRYLEKFSARGNVVIRTSRSKEFKTLNGRKKAFNNLNKHQIDTLIIIGGDGSYKGAYELSKLGINCITIPGTIDNDVSSSDTTIGFHTSLNTIVDVIDGLRDTFDSHKTTGIIEVMGRFCDDLAIYSSIASGTEAVVTSKNIFKLNDFVNVVNESVKNGKDSCLIIVAERLYGNNGLPTINHIAEQVEKITKKPTRACVLGHIQRGGTPTAYDRYIANIMAYEAIEIINKNMKNRAICLEKNKVKSIDLATAIKLKKVKINKYIKDFKRLSLI